ncbi:protein LBH isoform X1 [Sorex araneus]|uniref:protein LBH isoform X1 n=1 Tax=Sorex araneus TaxID=42254 RepID=UPI002433A42D|nr:protein LBH isoform X1 [Sorex araneus]
MKGTAGRGRALPKPSRPPWAAERPRRVCSHPPTASCPSGAGVHAAARGRRGRARDAAISPDCPSSAKMTEVMMNAPSMEEMGLSPRKDLSYQIFPDPSDFDRCCKLKDRLPSIVVEPTEGEVESGELRWPPEEFLVQEDEQDNCDETAKENTEQ